MSWEDNSSKQGKEETDSDSRARGRYWRAKIGNQKAATVKNRHLPKEIMIGMHLEWAASVL
jgi:hypothetical protein